jgi:hypothetical protein
MRRTLKTTAAGGGADAKSKPCAVLPRRLTVGSAVDGSQFHCKVLAECNAMPRAPPRLYGGIRTPIRWPPDCHSDSFPRIPGQAGQRGCRELGPGARCPQPIANSLLPAKKNECSARGTTQLALRALCLTSRYLAYPIGHTSIH